MQYWILKSEPDVYSFQDLVKAGKAVWDGVRNYQARNNLRAMKVGDIAFIYHSNIGKEIVGISKVVKSAYQDPKTKEDWSAVDLAPVKALKNPVTLEVLKKDSLLKEIKLVRMSRLSVSPISAKDYDRILKLSEKPPS